MIVRYRPRAKADALEAARWYDSRQPRLGDRFLDALEDLICRLGENPLQYQAVHRNIRRALLPDPFPQLVYYVVNQRTVEIHAVLHPARHPSHWKRRF